MNFKPILFNGEMVRAILEEQKTMTRRPVTLKYSNTHIDHSANKKYGCPLCEIQNDVEGETHGTNPDGSSWRKLLAMREVEPQYKVGDILWVRETWTYHEGADGGIIFKARCPKRLAEAKTWHPSIHMPKAAARIFLRVTGVRAERVQEIQTQDVHAEGVYLKECQRCLSENDECRPQLDVDVFCCMEDKAIDAFADIWDTCYAKPMPCKEKGTITCYISYPWEDVYETREHNGLPWYVRGNPWVWVYTYELVDKPEGWPI